MNTELQKIATIMMEIDSIIAKHVVKVKDVKIFSQTWGSTALGFGGMGGDALTEAYTTVITLSDFSYLVFFNNRLAYGVKDPTKRFFEDLRNRTMASVSEAEKLY